MPNGRRTRTGRLCVGDFAANRTVYVGNSQSVLKTNNPDRAEQDTSIGFVDVGDFVAFVSVFPARLCGGNSKALASPEDFSDDGANDSSDSPFFAFGFGASCLRGCP